MPINKEKYKEIIEELQNKATLVAVSKTKPNEDILELHNLGQRDFGENYVQELVDKEAALPKDIRWHFIGHLQSNKVKYIAPFVHLIHGVDSESLLAEINKQAAKNNRVIDCLLQVHIATEETKFGFDENELANVQTAKYANVQIRGLMGMASFSSDLDLVRGEFKILKQLFDRKFSNDQLGLTTAPDQPELTTDNSPFTIHHSQLTIHNSPFTLSMGMSGDYKIAIEEGSNMVRIGSLLFGERNYNK